VLPTPRSRSSRNVQTPSSFCIFDSLFLRLFLLTVGVLGLGTGEHVQHSLQTLVDTIAASKLFQMKGLACKAAPVQPGVQVRSFPRGLFNLQ
jgi:hypothetical protein